MKRLIAVLLIMVIAISCVACGSSVPMEKQFVKIDEYRTHHGYTVWLVFDPETKVEYFMRSDLMCPRYDENGNIVLYGGN